MVLPLPDAVAATTKALANGVLPERRRVPIQHFAPIGGVANNHDGRGRRIIFSHEGSRLF